MDQGLVMTGVGYRYPAADRWSVRGVDLRVAPGEVVLLTGPTGSGKSTLVRLASGLLQRHGEGTLEGAVTVAGRDPAQAPPRERVHLAGFVSQEPGDQLVAGTVGDELAFGLESAGAPPAETEAALPRLLAMVGLPVALDRPTTALSGGQTQRLVTGAALAAGAGLLLLDEPLAQLDPAGAAELLTRLAALAASGVAVLLVEHRLELAFDHCTRLAVFDGGRLVADEPRAGWGRGSDGRALLRRLGLNVPGEPVETGPVAAPTGPLLALARGLTWTWPGTERPALAPLDLALRRGERLALLGSNGAGKSTLLALLAGRLDGARRLDGALAVPQDPDLALFCASVREELAYGPREQGLPPDAVRARVEHAARVASLDDLLDQAPQALSRGQRLRCAVGAALACAPKVLLLDEPTSGQDRGQVERLMGALADSLAEGALVFATHDIGLARRHATRVIVLDRGRVVADGSPGDDPIPPAPAPEEPVAAPMAAPAGLDPRTRLALVLAAGVAAVTLDSPVSLGLFVLACLYPLVRLRISTAWWRRGLFAVAAVVWGTVLSQGLFYAEQPRVSLASLGPLHLYREGLLHGLTQSLRFTGMVLCGVAMAVSTPPDRLFAALVRLEVPFGLALMAATALRFLPEIGREVVVVRQAREARGRPAWRRAPWAWLWVEVGLLRPIVARAWRRAQNLAESLDARGFDPVVARPLRRPLRMKASDWAALGVAGSLALALAGARLLMVLYTSGLLYLPVLRPFYGFVRAWV